MRSNAQVVKLTESPATEEGSAEDETSIEFQATFAAALIGSTDMRSLASILIEHVIRKFDGRQVKLMWWLNSPEERQYWPEDALDANRQSLIEAALECPGEVTTSADGMRLAVSLCSHNAEFGAVLSSDIDPQNFRQHEWIGLSSRLEPLLANALEKEGLRASVRHLEQAEQLQRALFAIADLASSDMEMSQMLHGLHAIVGSLMYAENFYIALYDSDKDAIRFIHFVDVEDHGWMSPDAEIPLSQIERGLTWYLIRDGQALRGSNEQLRHQVSGPLNTIGADSVDWLGVPMLSNHTVRGVICVQSYIDRPRYTEADQALLSYVASHILTALDRKQVQEELENRVQQRTRELTIEVKERQRSERLQATLFRIAELSNTAVNLEQFYVAVHRIVGQWLNSQNFYIALLSEDGSQLHFPYFVDECSPRPRSRKPGRGLTEYVLRIGRPLLCDRSEIDNLEAQGKLVDMGAKALCWLGVPLVCGDRAVGVLAVQCYKCNKSYSERDQELLTFISYQIANGLERQRAAASLKAAYAGLEQRVTERTRELSEQIAVREKIELQLKHEVLHDSLTGLPNRACLREHLIRAMERYRRDDSYKFAVLFMDLDRFKVINDSAGHLVGDELLKEVAKRCVANVRAFDVVARLGGDEFAILMEDIHGSEDAVHLAQRVIAALHAPVLVDGKELFTSASVGIAICGPRYQDVDQILRDADIAMYRAKANDRQRFELFDERLHQEALHLLDLESDLRRAISRHEFEPYFQPIVRLEDGSVVGYEALLRWNHPRRGVLAPGAFLHVAEASGCLEAIDWQMFEQTCAVIPSFIRPGEYVDMNLSPRHFRSKDMDTRLLALLAEYGVSPSQVRIEVTEGTLMEKCKRVGEMLDRLRQAGVLTALDDFGTGYSSLSYLHRFQLHTVKIDRSFVTDLVPGNTKGSAAVVGAIMALSQSLGLEIVAEGIETTVQRDALLELGCKLGQGYLFARPQPLAKLIKRSS